MDHLNTLIPLLYISHLVIINYIHDVDKQPLCKGNLFPAIFMQILQIWFLLPVDDPAGSDILPYFHKKHTYKNYTFHPSVLSAKSDKLLKNEFSEST